MFYEKDRLLKISDRTDPYFNNVFKKARPQIFISLPMSDVDEETVKNKMNAIFNAFVKLTDMEIFGPILMDTYNKTFPEIDQDLFDKHVYCLGDSIKLMSKADMVIFADDAPIARGCCIEHKICVEYDINYTTEMEVLSYEP